MKKGGRATLSGGTFLISVVVGGVAASGNLVGPDYERLSPDSVAVGGLHPESAPSLRSIRRRQTWNFPGPLHFRQSRRASGYGFGSTRNGDNSPKLRRLKCVFGLLLV